MNEPADNTVERHIARAQIRMSALIELAMHNARLATQSGNDVDVISRARGDLRNALAKLECQQ